MQHTDRYDDVSATTNMEGVNTKEIEIEIKGNEVEMNWQSDYTSNLMVPSTNTSLVCQYTQLLRTKLRKRKETLRE